MVLPRSVIAERACSRIGEHETHGANRSPFIDMCVEACGFAANDVDGAGPKTAGYAWCAAFASYCLGLEKGIAGALTLGRKFKRTKAPQLGDLMFFSTDDKGAGHIGIALAFNDDLVLCCEGNSDNSVRLVWRHANEVKFASVSDDVMPLPYVEVGDYPIVRVSKKGTR